MRSLYSQPLNFYPLYFIPIFGFLSIQNEFLETFDVGSPDYREGHEDRMLQQLKEMHMRLRYMQIYYGNASILLGFATVTSVHIYQSNHQHTNTPKC